LRRHYGGSLAGKWILTAGLGRDGRCAAARRHHGGRVAAGDRVPTLAHRRCGFKTGYLDAQAKDIDEALAMMERASREGKPISVAVLGNAAEVAARTGAGAA